MPTLFPAGLRCPEAACHIEIQRAGRRKGRKSTRTQAPDAQNLSPYMLPLANHTGDIVNGRAPSYQKDANKTH